MRWLLVVALAGCNSLLGVHDFTSTDAAVDAPADASAADVPCSPISMLADRFQGAGSLGTLWGASAGGYMQTPMGLRVAVTDTFRWSSIAYYDLRESSFSIATSVEMAVGAPDISLEVLSQVAGNSAGFARSGATLELRRTHSGVVSTIASITFDQVAHRYLRFRASGTKLFYEASSDGATFAVLGTSDADALTFVQVMMTFGAANGSFIATISDANGGTPHGAACPIDRLADDFSAGLDKWARRVTSNATLSIATAAARFELEPNNMIGVAALESSTVYDLRGGALELEVPAMVDVTTDQAFVATVQARAARNIFQLGQVKGKLAAALERDGSGMIDTVATIDYDATAHRWWRIAASQDGVTWQVSPDAQTWTTLAIADQVVGLDNVEVILAAQGSAATAAGATIDNVGGP